MNEAGKKSRFSGVHHRNLEAILDRFENQWHGPQAPDISDFLNAEENSPSAGQRRDLILELVAIELEYRWRRANNPQLEEYLARFPELSGAGEALLPLIVEEYRVRHRWGDRPGLAEYLQRFPTHRHALPAAIANLDLAKAKVEFEQGAASDATIAHDSAAPSGSANRGSTLRVRCPHCQNLVETAHDQSLADLLCDGCGSHFSLVDPDAHTRHAPIQRTLGHFDLVERLGMGAFGEVWKARDRELDRTVAIKIPRKGSLNASEAEKFLREARAAAQLKHPNIVGIHEVGRDRDTIYIVSDLVRGLSLADWLTGQRPPGRGAVPESGRGPAPCPRDGGGPSRPQAGQHHARRCH